MPTAHAPWGGLYLLGEPGEEVPSPQEVQDQVELPLRLEGCGGERESVAAVTAPAVPGGGHCPPGSLAPQYRAVRTLGRFRDGLEPGAPACRGGAWDSEWR